MSDESARRFIVKTTAGADPLDVKLGGPSIGLTRKVIPLETEPLFKSIGTTGGRGMAASSDGTWHLVTAPADVDTARDWDICHALVSQNRAITLAEPDLAQRWQVDPKANFPGFGMRDGAAHPQDIGNGYAGDPKDNYWFRNDAHGQFDAANAAIASPKAGARVRIAHLDTGYDPKHASVPKFLRADLQRNFVDANAPNDATDVSNGPLNNFSHGCGTLSILAGAAAPGMRGFGCAPNAEVIPVRVADRVVLFKNSTIARGFDYVHGLCKDPGKRIHVLSMSMGGLPSQAWADAINALYEAGVFVVTASGNNYFNIPTHWVVYPARFDRVVAACGAMADFRPYANLPINRMAGNYGPAGKMATAIAGYTPNTPWARFGGSTLVDFDGNGTSAATPQVAGAAALWIQGNRAAYDAYPEDWMRVEAVRKALFDAARAGDPQYTDEFGHGMLRAADALRQKPAAKDLLRKTPPDVVDFALLKLLVGGATGLTANDGSTAMLQMEALQLAVASGIEMRIDLSTQPSRARAIEELLSRKDLSGMLRRTLQRVSSQPAPPPGTTTSPSTPPPNITPSMAEHLLAQAEDPYIPPPPFRRLRIYAYDPGQQTRPDLFDVSVATLNVRWEKKLERGPIGDYVEVVDVDPASNCCYAPVDLNDHHVLAQNGLAPSEPNPQFHQQMVYAVAMTTIARFERALGRVALWATHRITDPNGHVLDEVFVPRLRIYPHALREQNAYYNPQKVALLFGYFRATSDGDTVVRGAEIFAATSHDIIAHETTHALLDGLHARYSEPTNMDMAAFHEAFADIVALFQHFAMPESLMRQIRKSRGAVEVAENLGALARQFGEATGMHGALRQYVGQTGRDIVKLTDDMTEPHERGAVLVSAVFAAFTTIYHIRCVDLIRLATNGSGILPDGEISYDLSGRLAEEAAAVADQVLNMCIRALDYCPPVNLDFGDYIRALITADFDLVRDDARGYRVAFINAFRDRGIVPSGLRHLGEDSLVWEPPAIENEVIDRFASVVKDLDLGWSLNVERKKAYETSKKNARAVNEWLHQANNRDLRRDLGLADPDLHSTLPIIDRRQMVGHLTGELHPFQVYSVRPARRTAPDGSTKADLIIELTQTFRAKPNDERYRGGCTLIIDLNDNKLKYVVRKRLIGSGAAKAQIDARIAAMTRAAKGNFVYYEPADPERRAHAFAMLHRCGREC